MNIDHEAVIIGAGISGIGAAIKLISAGIDTAVLERADEFGGTWRANTYPGCACDVPSGLYSYSFEPNPHWGRFFAGQPEIKAYVTEVAERHDIGAITQFGTDVLRADWDDQGGRWRLQTSTGEITCRFLVAAAGPWNEPRWPDVPGLRDFSGEVFHSARWNHDYDLAGRRVAVIGSGASAVQFVPAIAGEVGELHLFQRTAQWVLPKLDAQVPSAVRAILATVPGAHGLMRSGQYAAMESLGLGFRHPALMRAVQAVGSAYLRGAVKDADLRRALTPDYTIGCKRILFSNTYLQSLTRPNVEVHPVGVAGVEGRTVIGADGTRREVDAIILGTGFHILDMPLVDVVHGRDGMSLADTWAGSPEAYLGTVARGFPNFFTMLGPSLGTGHSSAFAILEAQLKLLVAAVTHARDAGADKIEVRPEVQQAYVDDVQQALTRTVYQAGGCRSYYVDRNGRNSFSWPWSTGRLRHRVADFDPSDYELERTTVAQEVA